MSATIVFDSYWKFAAERQRIYEKRLKGESQPWTADPILQAHKFTNVFRAADRTSQYLIREVIYNPNASPDAEEVSRPCNFGQKKKCDRWSGCQIRKTDDRSSLST